MHLLCVTHTLAPFGALSAQIPTHPAPPFHQHLELPLFRFLVLPLLALALVRGVGFRVWGLGFRAQGLGLRV